MLLIMASLHAAELDRAIKKLGEDADLAIPVVRLQEDAVLYSGLITKVGLQRVTSLLVAHPHIKWLAINSAGGEINLGMDMGDLVYSHKLNVRVTFICASSCANYVFTAANEKIIDDGAIVGWHGSAIQKGLSGQLSRKQIVRQLQFDPSFSLASPEQQSKIIEGVRAQFKTYIAESELRQSKFFKKIHVNQTITVIGLSYVHGLYCMSVPDMAKFGVDKVTASRRYPKDSLPRFQHAHDPIYFLELGKTHVAHAG